MYCIVLVRVIVTLLSIIYNIVTYIHVVLWKYTDKKTSFVNGLVSIVICADRQCDTESVLHMWVCVSSVCVFNSMAKTHTFSNRLFLLNSSSPIMKHTHTLFRQPRPCNKHILFVCAKRRQTDKTANYIRDHQLFRGLVFEKPTLSVRLQRKRERDRKR